MTLYTRLRYLRIDILIYFSFTSISYILLFSSRWNIKMSTKEYLNSLKQLYEFHADVSGFQLHPAFMELYTTVFRNVFCPTTRRLGGARPHSTCMGRKALCNRKYVLWYLSTMWFNFSTQTNTKTTKLYSLLHLKYLKIYLSIFSRNKWIQLHRITWVRLKLVGIIY